MLYREIIAVCSQIHTKHMLCYFYQKDKRAKFRDLNETNAVLNDGKNYTDKYFHLVF